MFNPKATVLIGLFALFLSCDHGDISQNKVDPSYFNVSGVIMGGCNLAKKSSESMETVSDSDTVAWSVSGQSIECKIGFHAGCCQHFLNNAETYGDTIVIVLTDTNSVSCHCMCYYTFNFTFQIGDSFRHGHYMVKAVSALDPSIVLFAQQGQY
jgi:hypothetical protein